MQKQEKWYQKTIWIVVLLIVFFPVGLFLMWKYSTWNKWAKISISAIFVLGFISSMLSSENAAVPQNTQVQVTPEQPAATIKQETPKTVLDKIKDKEENAEVSINGSVLYIKENLKRSKKDYYHAEAKEVYNNLHELLDELPQDVTTICVWYDTEFIDKLGNKTTDTAYRINMPLDTLKSINWDNYIGLDFEGLSNGDMYAWQGLK